MPYAFITKVTNVRRHSNADRLQIGECLGSQVVLGMNTKEGDIGVYFATDCRLSLDYAVKNDLVARKDEAGNKIGGYLDATKCHIRALKLRGEISDGLFMPLESLSSYVNIKTLQVGDCVDTINGTVIAEKYIPRGKTKGSQTGKGPKIATFKAVKFPLFSEHIDTAQYAHQKSQIKVGDVVTFSLKMHGTSARTAKLTRRVYTKPNWFNNLLIALRLKKEYVDQEGVTVSGTRRVVLDSFGGGFYGTNSFRQKYHEKLARTLMDNETAYYEIVGWTDDGGLIMNAADNKELGKDFVKKYGDKTIFSYGCNYGENEAYLYRMTYTDPKTGLVIEYPTWLVQQRAMQMDMKHVPVFGTMVVSDLGLLDATVDQLTSGDDPIGKNHIREGCVVRVENREKFTAMKSKSFEFKVLEGIIKDSGLVEAEDQEAVDLNE